MVLGSGNSSGVGERVGKSRIFRRLIMTYREYGRMLGAYVVLLRWFRIDGVWIKTSVKDRLMTVRLLISIRQVHHSPIRGKGILYRERGFVNGFQAIRELQRRTTICIGNALMSWDELTQAFSRFVRLVHCVLCLLLLSSWSLQKLLVMR